MAIFIKKNNLLQSVGSTVSFGGSGDFELFHTTSVYEANDTISATDREKLETFSNNITEYCGFMYFTVNNSLFIAPINRIKIPNTNSLTAHNGTASGMGQIHCGITINWTTNIITALSGYVPTSNLPQVPTNIYIKIYKYK